MPTSLCALLCEVGRGRPVVATQCSLRAQHTPARHVRHEPLGPSPPPDEHCDIREWVLHHASLGVAKFYVFDTQSAEPMAPVLEDLVAGGLVTYTYVTNTSGELQLREPREGRSYNWQVPIFELCLRRHGAAHRWMGFIDADEFVVPTDPQAAAAGSSVVNDDGRSSNGIGSSRNDGGRSNSSTSSSGSGSGGEDHAGGADGGMLPALLRANEAHAGLLLHWRLFSFDGHVDRPGGGVLASYTACWPLGAGIHRHVKSFVQPALVDAPETPHSFFYLSGQHSVNTDGRRVKGPIVRKGAVSLSACAILLLVVPLAAGRAAPRASFASVLLRTRCPSLLGP